MSYSITDKTPLKCNEGTIETTLTVTSQTFLHIENKLQATEADKQPNINVKSFGLCKLKPSSNGYLPCVPVPMEWQNTSLFEIEGFKELLDISSCPCSIGGVISIVKNNQVFVEDSN